MSEENFVDYVKLYCRSGKGGAGCLHFLKTKGAPKGGPDGGDGGRGGHVILRGNSQYWTLLHHKYNRHVFAENGIAGSENNKTGRYGKNSYIEVPLGTIAKDAQTGEILGEVTEDKQQVILLQGGRGGLGNLAFTTSTNRAPHYAQPGEPHEEREIILELKLLADVGLVGFPNAGKSTLLSVLSSARPKIADYPFTTITPNLGIVAYRNYKSFVMADIPGIIEGAAEGRGLGLRFLRHIERNSCLLFMIPADADDIAQEYKILRGELERFNPELLHKDHLLVITKCDLLDDELTKMIKKTLPKKVKTLFISSIIQKGLTELKDALWELLQTEEINDSEE
jgi:GTP-binding protein